MRGASLSSIQVGLAGAILSAHLKIFAVFIFIGVAAVAKSLTAGWPLKKTRTRATASGMTIGPNNRVESDAVKRCIVSWYLGAGAAHAERYKIRDRFIFCTLKPGR